MPPADVITLIDRYLMFYIRTADKLQRTAPWLASLPGGITYLQDVILNDKLGICASLEAQMKELVDSYFDEWAEAIANPAMKARFTQFANSHDALPGMELQTDRDQSHPVHWTTESATEDFRALGTRSSGGAGGDEAGWSSTAWEPVIAVSHFAGADDMPNGISATIKRSDTQLAVWRVRGRYYATQQMCPHKRAFILSDGLIGQSSSASGTTTGSISVPAGPDGEAPAPWVSCPHHKRNFDLASGSCRNDASLSIATFAVEERGGMVCVLLPPAAELDAKLGTKKWMVRKGESGEEPLATLDRKYKLVGRRGRKPGALESGAQMMAQTPVIAAGGGCGVAPDW